jgi:N-acetylglucosamine-6-phosphate deacetylase
MINNTRTQIENGMIVTSGHVLDGATVLIEGGRIVEITEKREATRSRGVQYIDASGYFVAPGFIDIHIHGAAGYDTMDATPQAIQTIARFVAAHGVTGYLPTTMAAAPQATLTAVENVAGCRQPEDGAFHLGIHLEGPYLNAEHRGAQPQAYLRHPDPEEYHAWLAADCVRLITVAPELEGALAFIEQGVSKGIEFAVGHSGASYEQVVAAADRGLRQATHAFNGMLGLHHRHPGTLGAVLTDDRIYAQVIVDGVHVHPAIVKLLIRAKGVSRTVLITDAIRAAGLEDGKYDLGGQTITVQKGIARTTAGSLAGSTLTMDAGLRNLINYTGLSLAEALPMATSVPAEALGLAGRKGVLAPGADADIILLDADLNVCLTMVAGQIVYQNI